MDAMETEINTQKNIAEYSIAENNFRKFIKENYSELEITKKGLPDFMIMDKKHKIIGFVEVKRTDLNDNLRKEQIYFREYCFKNKIPYQIWSPNMARKEWKNFKNKKAWTQQTTNWIL